MSDSMGKAVWQAAKDGNEAELRRLIERGGNVNWHNPEDDGRTALMVASVLGYEGTMDGQLCMARQSTAASRSSSVSSNKARIRRSETGTVTLPSTTRGSMATARSWPC